MNEFERRLYDYLIEDGGACPAFFLQTALGINDFDALVEALNHLVAVHAVSLEPQGYRACKDWGGTISLNYAAALAESDSRCEGPRDSGWGKRAHSLSQENERKESIGIKRLNTAGAKRKLRQSGKRKLRSAKYENKNDSEDARGCFDGMTEQEIEDAFQDLFRNLGMQGSADTGRVNSDDRSSAAADAFSTSCDGSDKTLGDIPEECKRPCFVRHADPLNKCDFPTRAVGALSKLGINNVEQLCQLGKLSQFQSIDQIPGLGLKTTADAYAWLDARALHIDAKGFERLSPFERRLRSETDYFINRLGLLCRFDCGFEENLQLDGGEADTNALLHQTLRSLEMTDCTDSMLGGLERHGIRTVGDLLTMDTERVLHYRGWGVGKKRVLDALVETLREQVRDGSAIRLSTGGPAHPRLAFVCSDEPLEPGAKVLEEELGALGYPLYAPTATPWLNECAKKGFDSREAVASLVGQDPAPEIVECLANVLRQRIDEMVDKFRCGDVDACAIIVPNAPGWDWAARSCCDDDHDLIYDDRDRKLEKKVLSLDEWVASLGNDTKRIIMTMRLAGSTLQGVADEVGLTRERVRQIENKIFEELPLLSVLRLRRFVDRYDVVESQFVGMGLGSSGEYRCLNKIRPGKCGRLPVAAAIHDPEIADEVKRAVEALLQEERGKHYVQVEDGVVAIEKTEILRYLLGRAEAEGKSVLSADELLCRYRTFCSQNRIEDKKGLELGNSRALLAYLQRKDFVMASTGQAIRLYDFNDYDYSDLETALELLCEESIECSARVIGRRFPDLMDKYDLRNEYELHYVIRRLDYAKLMGFGLGRSPMITFGNGSRDEQIMDLIRRKGPITIDDLASAYEKKYGVSEDSFKASFVAHMSQYKHGNTYIINEKPLTGREKEYLEAELDGVACIPLEFIRQRFIGAFSLEESQKICDCNLNSLGYEVSEDLIVAKTTDVRETFSQLLDSLTFTFEGEEGLSAEVMSHSLFRSGLDSRLRQFKLIKFSHGEDGRTVFVSEKYLHDYFAIDASLMRSYVRRVIEFVGRGVPFTIKSLRDSGFIHALDLVREDRRFGDSFFENVLSAGIGDLRIGSSSCRDVRVFCVTNVPFSSVSLFEYLVARETVIELDELQDILRNEFGIEAELTYMRSVVAKSKIVTRPGDILFASEGAYAEYRDALFAAI